MKEQYKIDIKYQLKSYRNGLYAIPLFFLILLIAYSIGKTEPFFDPIFVTVIVIYQVLLSIPALIIHLKYYRENKDLIVEFDKAHSEIVFKKNNKDFKYKIDQLKLIERKVYKDFKLPEWQQNWFPMPWVFYGLIRIETPDNLTFNITSLMFDIKNPPLKVHSDKYCFFATIDKSIKELEQEKINKIEFQESEVKRFKEKYANYSLYELKEIIENDGIVSAASTAAKELLKNNTAANRPS